MGLTIQDKGSVDNRPTGYVCYPEEGNANCLAVEDESFWFRHRNACILEVIRRFPPQGTIYDVGGGNGVVALALQAAGHDVVMIEPGVEGARAARQRGIRSVVCSTFESADLEAGKVAGLGLFDVLEHLQDDVGILKQMHSRLRPGGRIYITVPAYQMMFSEDDRYAGHFRRYAQRSLDRRLRACGYSLEYATYMFAPLVLPVFLFRKIPSMLGVREYQPASLRNDHIKTGATNAVLTWMLSLEHRAIARGWRVPFGGSCLIVARKPTGESIYESH